MWSVDMEDEIRNWVNICMRELQQGIFVIQVWTGIFIRLISLLYQVRQELQSHTALNQRPNLSWTTSMMWLTNKSIIDIHVTLLVPIAHTTFRGPSYSDLQPAGERAKWDEYLTMRLVGVAWHWRRRWCRKPQSSGLDRSCVTRDGGRRAVCGGAAGGRECKAAFGSGNQSLDGVASNVTWGGSWVFGY